LITLSSGQNGNGSTGTIVCSVSKIDASLFDEQTVMRKTSAGIAQNVQPFPVSENLHSGAIVVSCMDNGAHNSPPLTFRLLLLMGQKFMIRII